MGLETAIAIGLITAGAGYMQAQEANRARRRQNEAVAAAGRAEQATARVAAEERRSEVARQQARYLGTVRASSAARSASGTSLELAGIAQGAESVSDINTQLMFDILGIGSRTEAQKDRNRANPFLSGLQSGMSGFSTGLAVGSSFSGGGAASGGALNTKQTFGGPPEMLGPPANF